jgi:MOSC domain-containing protein YiiM
MTGLLVAVCRVHALLPDRGNGVTAIDKRPLASAVRVRTLGLFGDVQVERQNHGGVDQAVYAYAEEDAERFAAGLGRAVTPGLFGENLRTSGVDVTGAVIGERWRIGPKALLEVTFPRTPCGTFERRMRVPGWQDTFRAGGAPGAYLRVLRTGSIQAGDAVDVVERPEHGVTIGRWFSHSAPADAESLLDADAAGQIRLGEKLRTHAERALRKAARRPDPLPAATRGDRRAPAAGF